MSQQQPKVLITGVAGFCGSHLAELLLEHGQQVAGLEMEAAATRNIGSIAHRIDLRYADLRDLGAVRRVVSALQPDHIYHLAGITKAPQGDGFQAMYEVNINGTINLLEAVRTERPDCLLLIAGSSAQYGLLARDDNPVQETQPFHPVTHYAVTKSAQDLLGYRYWASCGLSIVRTRAFNIIGPRQSDQFVGSAFARQVVEIERGMRPPLVQVGNLEAERDFVDVRDVVRAYRLALKDGEPGEVYNVCSGQAHSIRALLEGLLSRSTMKGIEIQQDPSRLQAADVPLQVGGYDRLQSKTGWQPQIPFEQSLEDLLNFWRSQI